MAVAQQAQGERLVSNVKLRKAFRESGQLAGDVAFNAGVTRTYRRGRPGSGRRIRGDSTTLLRELGIKKTVGGYKKTKIPMERALKYAEAMGLFPVDIGL